MPKNVIEVKDTAGHKVVFTHHPKKGETVCQWYFDKGEDQCSYRFIPGGAMDLASCLKFVKMIEEHGNV